MEIQIWKVLCRPIQQADWSVLWENMRSRGPHDPKSSSQVKQWWRSFWQAGPCPSLFPCFKISGQAIAVSLVKALGWWAHNTFSQNELSHIGICICAFHANLALGYSPSVCKFPPMVVRALSTKSNWFFGNGVYRLTSKLLRAYCCIGQGRYRMHYQLSLPWHLKRPVRLCARFSYCQKLMCKQ